MSFTYDLSTQRGKVRLKLADTSATAYIFEDEEIDEFMSEGGSVINAAILGLKTLLVDRARRVKSFAIQGLSLSDTSQVQAIQAAISLLGGDMPTLTSIMPAALEMDGGFDEPTVG